MALSKPRQVASSARVQLGRRWRYADRSVFDDRSTGADHLIIILSGHKPKLWPATLPRQTRAVPDGADVCLVTPGVVRPELRRHAAEHGWSYLSTHGGHVSVAQNLAIRAHPRATSISKVDEDIFIGADFFALLRSGYERVAREAEHRVGFASPTINVNGFSYVDYLRVVGGSADYAERFGGLRRAADNVPAQADGAAAVALWEQAVPVDSLVETFAAEPWGYSIVPQRFSIGAIHFRRELWTEMDGFARREKAPGLGDDEGPLCSYCASSSRIIVVLHDLYAGHYAFGPQTPAMDSAHGDVASW